MHRISPQTEKRIIELWFKGLPRDTIARRTGVSGSTVSKVISQLPECLRELRLLSVELRKSGKSLHEALKGAQLLSKLHDIGVDLDRLQSFIQVVNKLSRQAEYQPKQVVQGAIKLSDLEESSGKLYPEAIKEFEAKTNQNKKLAENARTLKTQVRHLKEESETTTKNLERLNEKSKNAQKVLDTLAKTKLELAIYELKPNDFETVKVFLNEIHRLGGSPAKAVEILKETLSLRGKLQEKIDQFNQLKQFHKQERQNHRIKIREIEEKKKGLEKEITSKEEKLRQLIIKEFEQHQKIEGLTKRAKAIANRIDGLLRKQAALLQVQPDIDLVSEALPARKKELERLEQQIKEKRTVIVAAKAIAELFAKKPYDRNAVVQWLKLTEHDTAYGPFDKLTCQTIVKLMAEQGFVPIENLKALKKKAEKEIVNCKGQTETWRRIAKNRLDEYEECQKQLKREKVAKDKKLDESIDNGIANIAKELLKRVTTS